MLDGCNMAMASVAYEVKDYAEALTASEEAEPGVVLAYGSMYGNTERMMEAVARGIFGAPSFIVADKLYWGNDRLLFVEEQLAG